jgi:hypothetical protein
MNNNILLDHSGKYHNGNVWGIAKMFMSTLENRWTVSPSFANTHHGYDSVIIVPPDDNFRKIECDSDTWFHLDSNMSEISIQKETMSVIEKILDKRGNIYSVHVLSAIWNDGIGLQGVSGFNTSPATLDIKQHCAIDMLNFDPFTYKKDVPMDYWHVCEDKIFIKRMKELSELCDNVSASKKGCDMEEEIIQKFTGEYKTQFLLQIQ